MNFDELLIKLRLENYFTVEECQRYFKARKRILKMANGSHGICEETHCKWTDDRMNLKQIDEMKGFMRFR